MASKATTSLAAELEALHKTLRATVAETKKLVKIAVDKTGWLAFWISDKQ